MVAFLGSGGPTRIRLQGEIRLEAHCVSMLAPRLSVHTLKEEDFCPRDCMRAGLIRWNGFPVALVATRSAARWTMPLFRSVHPRVPKASPAAVPSDSRCPWHRSLHGASLWQA